MQTKHVIVTGDVAVDTHIYNGSKVSPDMSGPGTQIKTVKGGAYMLYQLIDTLTETISTDFGFDEKIFDEISAIPNDLNHFASWNLIEYTKKTQETAGVQFAWKISEKMGVGADESSQIKNDYLNSFVDKSQQVTGMLVFDDGASDFRNRTELWEHLLDKIEHIVLKMGAPVARGLLFKKLVNEFSDKLIIVTSIENIRKEPALISSGISWEQTALDLIHELNGNRNLVLLKRCRHLFVTIHLEGVLYLKLNEGKIEKARLIFDPDNNEGEWERSQGIDGEVIGLMNCFTAGVVREFLSDEPRFDFAATRGLAAQRRYKIVGHLSSTREFPFKDLAKEIETPSQTFASSFVPVPEYVEKSEEMFKNAHWTILQGNYALEKAKEPLYDVGFRLAVSGEKELAHVPNLRINEFLTYNRSEIEALRNLKQLIIDYLQHDKGKKPLSLAIFGAPGAGKSYAVGQLAKDHDIPFLEFNLSQFEDVDELIGALHQVRDAVLKGTTPMIFWDEFDSQDYRWLQYLLAPMQDGKFQEGQVTHPIGKCIFIFAGGTSFSFETFGVPFPSYPDSESQDFEKRKQAYDLNMKRFDNFKLKKGPDFKSRLTGYLNVLGPNQLEKRDASGKPEKDASDILFPIRRALFIRNIFDKKGKAPLNADAGVINALLKTDKFRHGSRSLEKILRYMKQKNKDVLKRSNLPPYSVLSMLVDYDQFIAYLDERDDFTYHAFDMAPGIHNSWMKKGDSKGSKQEYHKPYELLPSHLKEDNIASALRIPKVLSSQGLCVVKKADADFYESVDFHKIIEDKDKLDGMAIAEHEGWVKYKEEQNWKPSETRNDDKKQHDCMVPWDELRDAQDDPAHPEGKEQKDKDRNLIGFYSGILDKAGFVIVKKRQNKT